MSVDFSSWPREQEATFQVYEQQNRDASNKAWTFGGIIAGVVFIFAVGVYFGVEPKHHDITKDMNMSNLTKKDADKKPDAPAADKK
jgi:cell division protein FtsN